jgi:hypothetical protein
MKNQGNEARKNEVRMELKYCERCGMLWTRECGSGVVYCNVCQPAVTELPILKKRPQSVKLGIGRRAAIDDYRFDACAARPGNLRGRGGAA